LEIKRFILPGLILLLILLLVMGACTGNKDASDSNGNQNVANGTGNTGATDHGRVEITTSDGIAIIGTLVKASGAERRPACLLVHQFGSDRNSYAGFQQKLLEAGINSLAIDMRGHGESTGGGTLKYDDFNNEQWAECQKDIRAGLDYLRNSDCVNPSSIGIVGASIGANLSILEAADEMQEDGFQNRPTCMVLLSPGTDYHGIQPLQRGHDLEYIPVYIVSAEEDQQSYRGSQSLSQAARGGELVSFPGSEHGTNLFDAHPELIDQIVEWLSRNITGNGGSGGIPPFGSVTPSE
jgi:pimeloyl-ACP methyl ester carboxylesterase